MVQHIVMWKLQDFAQGGTRAQNAAKIKAGLEGLVGRLDMIEELEVGINWEDDGSADVVLVSKFASKEALDAYQVHPEHQAVAGFVKQVCTARYAVDYEV